MLSVGIQPYNTNPERLPRPVSLVLACILSDPWQSRIEGQEGHRGRLPNSVKARRPGNIEAEVLIAATRSARESRLVGVSSSRSKCKRTAADARPLYKTLRHWSAPGKQREALPWRVNASQTRRGAILKELQSPEEGLTGQEVGG